MFQRKFDGKEKLADLEAACVDIQKIKTANLTNIQGRNAKMPDGTKKNVNVCDFEPQNDVKDVHADLKFVKKQDATVEFIAKMAKQGRKQIGNKDGMDVFIEDKPEVILIYGK